MNDSLSLKELIELREKTRNELHNVELNFKQIDLNQTIEQLKQEKKSNEIEIHRNTRLFQLLYPDKDIKVNKSYISTLTENLEEQIDLKFAELYDTILYKKHLRSSIKLYSQQIEHLKQQYKKEEKKEEKKEFFKRKKYHESKSNPSTSTNRFNCLDVS